VDTALFKKLYNEQLITGKELNDIEQQQNGPVSVFWDVTTLLYFGVLLITAGLGIVVYKNIDTIGHTIIVATIGLLCATCFVYCFNKGKGFSYVKVESPNVLFDYVVLAGCLLMLTFVGYLQFAYNVFGSDWGLATFIPMIALFFAAYYFDHLGVLTMAITNLAAWAGFTVAPLKVLDNNDFDDTRLIFTGMVLGAGLIGFAFLSIHKKLKAHFAFTYQNFGVHILLISLFAAMFQFERIYLVLFAIIMGVTLLLYRYAVKENSFYFLVVSLLYGYVAVSFVLLQLLSLAGRGEGMFYLVSIYFIASGIGLIWLIIRYSKTFKKDAHI
jgi:hypothetical protein